MASNTCCCPTTEYAGSLPSRVFFLLLPPHKSTALLAHGGPRVGTSPEQGGGVMRYVDLSPVFFFLLVPGDDVAASLVVGCKAERLLQDQETERCHPTISQDAQKAGRGTAVFIAGQSSLSVLLGRAMAYTCVSPLERMAPQQPLKTGAGNSSSRHTHHTAVFIMDCFPNIVAGNNGASQTTANTRFSCNVHPSTESLPGYILTPYDPFPLFQLGRRCTALTFCGMYVPHEGVGQRARVGTCV